MNVSDALALARAAKTAHPSRPAMTVVHDSADARVVLFRIEPGQQVAVHTSVSSVVAVLLEGSGIITGTEGERPARAGDIVTYAPEEPHGFRAEDQQLVIAAIIAPRPMSRH